jgi:hypothetical protein
LFPEPVEAEIRWRRLRALAKQPARRDETGEPEGSGAGVDPGASHEGELVSCYEEEVSGLIRGEDAAIPGLEQEEHPFRIELGCVGAVKKQEIGAVVPGNAGFGSDPEKTRLRVPLKPFDTVGREAVIGGETLDVIGGLSPKKNATN